MHINLSRADLVAALATLRGTIKTSRYVPILMNVKIEADSLKVRLTGTDINQYAVVDAQANVLTEGAATVNFKSLQTFAKSAPLGGRISLESLRECDLELIKVSAGAGSITLPTLPVADFPFMGMVAEGAPPDNHAYTSTFNIPAVDLNRMFSQCAIAISNEEARYYLNGIYVHMNAGKLRAVSTDGHRLARIDGPAFPDLDFPGVIIPRLTCAEIICATHKSKGIATIELSSKRVKFTLGAFSIESTLVDGTFPDYARVVPQDPPQRLIVDREAFLAATKRASRAAPKNGNAVRLSIEPTRLTFTVHNPDTGDSVESIACEFSHAPAEVVFNAGYLHSLASVCHEALGTISMRFQTHKGSFDAGAPAIMTPYDGAPETFVVMPLRLTAKAAKAAEAKEKEAA